MCAQCRVMRGPRERGGRWRRVCAQLVLLLAGADSGVGLLLRLDQYMHRQQKVLPQGHKHKKMRTSSCLL